MFEKSANSSVTNSLRRTISRSNLSTLKGYYGPKKLMKVPKAKMPKGTDIKSSLGEVSKIKPRIIKAPEPKIPEVRDRSVKKVAREKMLLEKIAVKLADIEKGRLMTKKDKEEASKIPGTSYWIKKMREGD